MSLSPSLNVILSSPPVADARPASTRRRMASDLDGRSLWRARQASTSSNTDGPRRISKRSVSCVLILSSSLSFLLYVMYGIYTYNMEIVRNCQYGLLQMARAPALRNFDFEKPFSKSIGFGERRCQDVLFRVVSERDFC